MNYRYDFEGGSKSKKGKIIFIVIMLIVTVIVASFFFRSSSHSLLANISSAISFPFVKIYEATTGGIDSVRMHFSNVEAVVARNEQLEQEKKELEFQVLETQKILDENEVLKQMLEIKKAFQHFEVKLGKIIYREHDNWTQTFKVDIGKEDGVLLNQAVIHSNGLVGYVTKVEKNTCTITTILDPSSSVSVNISTINEPAILQGDLSLKSNNRLRLESIPLDAEVSASDMLYTSGLGSMYPSSIPVGKIIEVVNNKNDINRYAIVEPNVNIRTISEVGIIIN